METDIQSCIGIVPIVIFCSLVCINYIILKIRKEINMEQKQEKSKSRNQINDIIFSLLNTIWAIGTSYITSGGL